MVEGLGSMIKGLVWGLRFGAQDSAFRIRLGDLRSAWGFGFRSLGFKVERFGV